MQTPQHLDWFNAVILIQAPEGHSTLPEANKARACGAVFCTVGRDPEEEGNKVSAQVKE